MTRFPIQARSLAVCTAAIAFVAIQRPACALDGGLEDNDTDPAYPNVCAVIGVPANPEGPLRMASGILIHPRVVLTAGHVTDWFATIWDVPPERARISFSADAFDDSQWLEVEDYITHPLYNGYAGTEGRGDLHDLGLVILNEDVQGISPATLPYGGLLDDMNAAGLLDFGVTNGTLLPVVGYGWGFSFPPPTPIPSERGVRRYGLLTCMGLMKSSLHLQRDPDGVVTQNGDSGGPTFVEDGDGNRVLVAIVAWGTTPGLGHHYRVDTADSLDFIDWVLSTVDSP